MNKRVVQIIGALFIFVSGLTACKSQNYKSLISPDTIPFSLTVYNNISVKALLNKEDTISLMFHTDISSVSLTPEMCLKLDSIQQTKSSEVNSWTGSKEMKFIENNSLSIGDMHWENLIVWLNMLSGQETDGKFGPNLFEGKIIEINYDRQFIVLHDPEYLNINEEVYKRFDLTSNENNSLFLEGTFLINGKAIKNKLLIHSGYGGTIILDDNFFKAHDEFAEMQIVDENELKDSFGNIIKTKKALVDQFTMSDIVFENMPINYFDSKREIQGISVLGGELLKRFNLFLDIENLEIYMSENKFTSLNFKRS